jgi:glycosyltransferase involved in cell wall biosynthesis
VLITIAIPTYNSENTISETLESCLNQKYSEDYEILIVDNNSNDNTLQKVQNFQKYGNIRIAKIDKTVSMYENHNRCVNFAQSDYLVFCHSDDQLFPNTLDNFHSIIKMRKFPRKYICWGRSYFRDFSPQIEDQYISLCEVFKDEKAITVFSNGGLTPSGTMYSLNSFRKVGGFIACDNPKSDSLDFSTMIYLAIMGFHFEMRDEYFFKRRFSSTANSNYDFNKHAINALECLSQLCSQEELKYLLNTVVRYNNMKHLSLFERYMLQKSHIDFEGVLKD